MTTSCFELRFENGEAGVLMTDGTSENVDGELGLANEDGLNTHDIEDDVVLFQGRHLSR